MSTSWTSDNPITSASAPGGVGATLPPTPLRWGVAAAVAAALATAASQALAWVRGRDAIDAAVRDELGPEAVAVSSFLQSALDSAYRTLQTRAVVGLVLAGVVAGLALTARRAALWVRILLGLFLLMTAAVMVRSVTDIYPTLSVGLGWIAILLAVAAAVMVFLPGVGRYRRALRASRRR